MAWRIDKAVVRGELDNRVRGRVTGRIWFVERAEPVVLELQGNCWRDLAQPSTAGEACSCTAIREMARRVSPKESRDRLGNTSRLTVNFL